jgi:hypothetical protein
VLEDRQRKYELCYGEHYSALLAGGTYRLIVLNACKTAASSKVRRLVGLAPRLARDGTPAVVAICYQIVDDAANSILQGFYWALARAWAVDAAVARARKGLLLEEESGTRSHRFWFMPVVFMHTPDRKIYGTNSGPTWQVKVDDARPMVPTVNSMAAMRQCSQRDNVTRIDGDSGPSHGSK